MTRTSPTTWSTSGSWRAPRTRALGEERRDDARALLEDVPHASVEDEERRCHEDGRRCARAGLRRARRGTGRRGGRRPPRWRRWRGRHARHFPGARSRAHGRPRARACSADARRAGQRQEAMLTQEVRPPGRALLAADERGGGRRPLPRRCGATGTGAIAGRAPGSPPGADAAQGRARVPAPPGGPAWPPEHFERVRLAPQR